MGEATTLFSKIIEGEIPCFEIAKGDTWLAFLDINPRRDGHTLVVPHEPVRHLAELSSNQLSDLWQGVVETQKKLKFGVPKHVFPEKLGPEGPMGAPWGQKAHRM